MREVKEDRMGGEEEVFKEQGWMGALVEGPNNFIVLNYIQRSKRRRRKGGREKEEERGGGGVGRDAQVLAGRGGWPSQ